MIDNAQGVMESAADVAGELKPALVDLLYRLADDELVIGHRNSEWTGLGPILEADIAFSSMAQDEIGHALAYFRLLHDLGAPEPDKNAFLRDAGAFHCCSLAALGKRDWAFSLARQFLYDAAEHIRLIALCESSYRPLAVLARKFLGEEKYHLMHGRTWLRHLGHGTDESRQRMQAALDAAMPHAYGIFESTRAEPALVNAGVCPAEAELKARWLPAVEAEIRDAGLLFRSDEKPFFGGRGGDHPPEFAELVEAMQRVYRLEPSAAW